MSRNLTVAQQNELDNAVYLQETLIEIVDTTGTKYYYTTASVDATVETTTSGGAVTFEANSLISEISEITEYEVTTDQRLGLVLVGTDLSVPLNWQNGSEIILHKLFRNVSDYSIVTSDPIQTFKGVIVKRTRTMSATEQSLQIDCIFRTGSLNGQYSPLLNKNPSGVAS